MKVKSKYNLKDSVWFMEYNHVQNGIVSGIFFRVTREGEGEKTNVVYHLNSGNSDYPEEILFPSKKQLLNTL